MSRMSHPDIMSKSDKFLIVLALKVTRTIQTSDMLYARHLQFKTQKMNQRLLIQYQQCALCLNGFDVKDVKHRRAKHHLQRKTGILCGFHIAGEATETSHEILPPTWRL
eukprot:scaffold315256_cov29-Prasinocladus_malaysianus.AAC.1